MKLLRVFVASVLATGIALAADQASSSPPSDETKDKSDKSAEKPARRLKGEFKGHPIAVASESDADANKETPKPAPAKPAPAKSAAPAQPQKAGAAKPEKTLVIDNAMVRPEGAAVSKTTAKGSPSGATPAPPSAPPPAVVSIAPVDLNGNGEAYWRARAKQARDQLAQAQQTLEAAQLEEKREENDFYAWDDGQYRDNVIKPAWDRSREETAKAQEALTAAQKAVEALDDDARKAGAYPGWIRE